MADKFGWEVVFYYPMKVNLICKRKKDVLFRALKIPLRIVYYKTAGDRFYCWYTEEDIKNVYHKPCFKISINELLSYNIIVVTSVETAIYIKELLSNNQNIPVLYFIQHFEDWNVSAQEVINSYNFGFYNIVVSKWLADIVKSNGSKVDLYLPNPIDDIFKVIISPYQREYFSILFLYHPAYWKGSLEALKSILILKEKFPSLKVSCFSAYDKPKQFPDFINYYKLPTRKELLSLYNEHFIFLHLAYKEGFGLPPAEAMKCGCLVVSTRSGGVEDFCINGKTAVLLNSPPDVNEIVKTLTQILNNVEEYIPIAINGSNFIKNFNITENLEKLYNFILTITKNDS